MDPIVRVQASRLRAKLREYFDVEGRQDPILIEYPRGTYVPAFSRRRLPANLPESSPPSWRTIAVLPFFDLSPEGDLEYLASGISEETISKLSRFRELRVVAYTSVLQFRSKPLDVREIGRQLEVGAVLEGSVRRAGPTLRISSQLVEVASGYVVWSEIHECSLDNCLEVQKKASQAVARRMRLLITQAKRQM